MINTLCFQVLTIFNNLCCFALWIILLTVGGFQRELEIMGLVDVYLIGVFISLSVFLLLVFTDVVRFPILFVRINNVVNMARYIVNIFNSKFPWLDGRRKLLLQKRWLVMTNFFTWYFMVATASLVHQAFYQTVSNPRQVLGVYLWAMFWPALVIRHIYELVKAYKINRDM